MKDIGGANGPSERQACKLDRWKESVYVSGNDVTVEGFYAQRKLSYVGSVERKHYNPSVGTNCGIIVTKTVCSV